MEVQVEEEESRMIKLKDLYPNQVSFNKKKYFGETSEEPVTESIKVIPSNKIDSRTWRSMKYDLRDQFDELVKIGEDYKVFQNAQGTSKMLKQIKRIMDKI
jgi:hypothetical protein